MTHRLTTFLALLAAAVVLSTGSLHAQALGSFSWQLQPFCNTLTVNVTQQGSVYTIDGYDDQCGAGQHAPLVGVATQNPDGTIGLGFHIITVPGGRAVDVDARITLATLGGPWSDSAGNSGTLAFNAHTGGSARPLPTIPGLALTPGSITTALLAPGAVTTANIADGSITTPLLAPGAVTTAKIAAGSITSPLLAPEAVNTANLANGSVTPQKLSVPMPILRSSGLQIGAASIPADTTQVMRTVTMSIPAAGQVLLDASGLFEFHVISANLQYGWCSITTGTEVETANYLYARTDSRPIGSYNTLANLPFSGTRVYDVTPGAFTVNLVCYAGGNLGVTVQSAQLTALFVPN